MILTKSRKNQIAAAAVKVCDFHTKFMEMFHFLCCMKESYKNFLRQAKKHVKFLPESRKNFENLLGKIQVHGSVPCKVI